MRVALIAGALLMAPLLSNCAYTSSVMDAGDGTYFVSAHASPVRGGAAGATSAAYDAAQDFCAKQGSHAIVVTDAERDVSQSAFGGGFSSNGGVSSGSIGGGSFVGGNANLRFRCR